MLSLSAASSGERPPGDVVDVEIRQIADQRVGGVLLRLTHVLAVQPLVGSVGAQVHHRVGAESLAQP